MYKIQVVAPTPENSQIIHEEQAKNGSDLHKAVVRVRRAFGVQYARDQWGLHMRTDVAPGRNSSVVGFGFVGQQIVLIIVTLVSS